jgi:TonB family protein
MKKSTCACIALLSLLSFPGWAGDEVRFTEAELKEAATVKPLPEYPMVARQLKITGKVELEVHVDEGGQVTDVKILTGNAVLTRPTAKTISGWKFKAFQKDGKPVQAVAPLSFEFR